MSSPPSDNLYITGLATDLDDATFKQVFAQYGTVQTCRLLGNGVGLVRMGSVEEATWLVQNLSGGIPQGMAVPVTVTFKVQKGEGAKGYTDAKGNWHPASPDGGKNNFHQPYDASGGWGGKDGGWGGKDGGWGSKDGGKGGFSNGRHASGLIKALKESGKLPGEKGSTTVFCHGLPSDMQNQHLYEIFAGFGTITRVSVVTHPDSGMCRGFGFADFTHPAQAHAAIAALNDADLPRGKKMHVSIKKDKGEGKGGAPPAAAPVPQPQAAAWPTGADPAAAAAWTADPSAAAAWSAEAAWAAQAAWAASQ